MLNQSRRLNTPAHLSHLQNSLVCFPAFHADVSFSFIYVFEPARPISAHKTVILKERELIKACRGVEGGVGGTWGDGFSRSGRGGAGVGAGGNFREQRLQTVM